MVSYPAIYCIQFGQPQGQPPPSLHPFLFKLALSRILFFRGKPKIAQANMFSGTGPSTVGGSGRSFPLRYWDRWTMTAFLLMILVSITLLVDGFACLLLCEYIHTSCQHTPNFNLNVDDQLHVDANFRSPFTLISKSVLQLSFSIEPGLQLNSPNGNHQLQ